MGIIKIVNFTFFFYNLFPTSFSIWLSLPLLPTSHRPAYCSVCSIQSTVPCGAPCAPLPCLSSAWPGPRASLFPPSTHVPCPQRVAIPVSLTEWGIYQLCPDHPPWHLFHSASWWSVDYLILLQLHEAWKRSLERGNSTKWASAKAENRNLWKKKKQSL